MKRTSLSSVRVIEDADRPSRAGRNRRRRVRVDGYRLALAIALVYFVVTFVNQQLVLFDLRQQLSRLENEIATVQAERAALEQELRERRSDSYVLDQARDRFGLSRPGEIQYRTVDVNEATVDDDEDATAAAADAQNR